MTIKVKFWGVRGSIACPSANHIKYGGNTSCVEIDADGHRLVMDAGTGIRGLGKTFLKDNVADIHLLLTHTHWDHINGFPFFIPAYDPRRKLHIMAGHLRGREGIQNVLATQMDNPMFPVPLSAMQARMRFEDFEAGDSFDIYEGVHVRTTLLNHPNGATGYRIEHGANAVCYVTDTEHVPGKPDQNILSLIEGADLVIYDSTYTEAEFPSKIGWGHSTWNVGVELCRMAGAKSMAIFHHDPEHDDAFMDKLEAEAQAEWPHCFAAREGMELTYGD
ncbi:MAG: MBL fold metallo-hydrolase [Alphaproteobacteria bacterium]|nr:MBL fold metallo-hydrolase [Alphaproteobacteria bacterium]MBF0250665.1 MBL fold metallo-hydrolase [Alphaproteobacteria bacterium]